MPTDDDVKDASCAGCVVGVLFGVLGTLVVVLTYAHFR